MYKYHKSKVLKKLKKKGERLISKSILNTYSKSSIEFCKMIRKRNKSNPYYIIPLVFVLKHLLF